jgi:hypothetical protein
MPTALFHMDEEIRWSVVFTFLTVLSVINIQNCSNCQYTDTSTVSNGRRWNGTICNVVWVWESTKYLSFAQKQNLGHNTGILCMHLTSHSQLKMWCLCICFYFFFFFGGGGGGILGTYSECTPDINLRGHQVLQFNRPDTNTFPLTSTMLTNKDKISG